MARGPHRRLWARGLTLMRLGRLIRSYSYGASMAVMMGIAYGVDHDWWAKWVMWPSVVLLIAVNALAKADGDGWAVRRRG